MRKYCVLLITGGPFPSSKVVKQFDTKKEALHYLEQRFVLEDVSDISFYTIRIDDDNKNTIVDANPRI